MRDKNTELKKKVYPIDIPLLHQLLHFSEPVSLDYLDSIRDKEGTAPLLQALDKLERVGCVFSRSGNQIQLLETGIGTWADLCKLTMSSKIVKVYHSTSSTQDVAFSICKPGVVIITNEQSYGRGRMRRQWQAPADTAVLMSQMIEMPASTTLGSGVDRLTLIASVAVAEAIEGVTGHRIRPSIKWPNDIYVEGLKLCGILVEVRTGRAVVGIGVNVNILPKQFPSDLRGKVTSMRMLGEGIERVRIIIAILRTLDAALSSPVEAVLSRWRDRCLTLGTQVKYLNRGQVIEGEVVDVDADAGLILRRRTGELVYLKAHETTSHV